MQRAVRHIVIALFLAIVQFAFGQNLIPNPGFEKYSHCPMRMGNFSNDVKHWTAPTKGSTDYFNSCSQNMPVPENFNGVQMAESGFGYAGLYLYAPDDYREYMQVALSQVLKKGETYRLRFYMNRAERADFATREVGILLTASPLEVNTKKVLSKRHWITAENSSYTYFEIRGSDFYSDKDNWKWMSAEFTAKGGEQYLIIGNFKTNQKTRVSRLKKNAKKGAYYYFDSFSLKLDTTKRKDLLVLNTKGKVEPPSINTTIRFTNVLFEFDKSVLLDSAKNDIQKIYQILETNQDLKILIEGHTDNIGSAAYNKKLSDNRCRAVAEYLKSLGLPQERISWRAHGGNNPIADNTTKKGRKLNRRVEFMFVADK